MDHFQFQWVDYQQDFGKNLPLQPKGTEQQKQNGCYWFAYLKWFHQSYPRLLLIPKNKKQHIGDERDLHFSPYKLVLTIIYFLLLKVFLILSTFTASILYHFNLQELEFTKCKKLIWAFLLVSFILAFVWHKKQMDFAHVLGWEMGFSLSCFNIFCFCHVSAQYKSCL